jgi:alcohol dehydrogenase
MTPFDFRAPTRLLFGSGRLAELGRVTRELGAGRALWVSDPGVVAAGHAQRALDALSAEHIDSLLFDGVIENPTTAQVQAGLAVARRFEPELVIGLGGGSSMDCAKGINLLYTNGGNVEDYWGVGKASRATLPSIAVPTTAGTGSEAQSFALISDPVTHMKMACGDEKMAFRAAVLDPTLTVTQPPLVTSLSGIDALSHAIESHVSTRRTLISNLFSREAWRLLSGGFPKVLRAPDDLEARAEMQLGACLAGLAIEHSMLGAAHALANPLTACLGLSHGQAVGLMLPHVVRYNGREFAGLYADLLQSTAGIASVPSPAEGPDGLAHFLSELLQAAGLAVRLSECGFNKSMIPELAAGAARQWTASFNPRPVGPSQLERLYEEAY